MKTEDQIREKIETCKPVLDEYRPLMEGYRQSIIIDTLRWVLSDKEGQSENRG